MLTVPGKIYYLDQGEQITVVPNKIDISALERGLTDSCYYLRGWEIAMPPGEHMQLILEILTYDNSDGHTPAIMRILSQHGLHVKDLNYYVVANHMYYNIVAYVAEELAIPDPRVIDPYQDEVDNPLI